MDTIKIALLALVLAVGLSACSGMMGDDSEPGMTEQPGGMESSDDDEGATEGNTQ